MAETPAASCKRTPLFDLHVELGAKMVPFAGYEMPVQYPLGVLKEHNHTRENAGLFDVSHMGQAWLVGEDAAAALETLVPAELQALEAGQQRYTQLLNEDGTILDDLMVTRPVETEKQDRLYLVVNAACKDQDFALITEKLAGRAKLEIIDDHALIAIQGPKAVDATAAIFGDVVRTQSFMSQQVLPFEGKPCLISRSGYTGEDGYEISVPADLAEALSRAFINQDIVEPIGLGARDSLRLEAGLCLYGNDIDTTTTPIEAGLIWSIGKRRREEGGFPGASVIQKQIADGVERKRVGIQPEGRAPAREGTPVTDGNGNEIGKITSGGFGPTVGGPVAMGYVAASHKEPGTAIHLLVRGKEVPAKVVKLPFVKPGFYRG
ncbi:glycine cleavage system aminomethyltransferase GcvT [Aestuariispira insulae]|uniref:aminomethyltransferase n=1 Tax=Aestuariispira insulae TaxID=1461337 RepID=A0A3D9HGI2_9PROT|nr:glycine cleavage system aminomethyltransferase GcvT [Aestuariispira insulae]RED48583.1 aminomethyltransferase [Aestuariispira insulae]